jgi:hypothetical protein
MMRRYRIMGGRKNQTIWVIQVDGKLAAALALRQFMASAGPAFGRPEIHETYSGSKLRHSQANFSRTLNAMHSVKLSPFAEFLCKLSVPEKYLQNPLSVNYD